MSLIRFRLELAIPEDVYNAISGAKKTTFVSAVRAMRVLAVKINEGKENEEATITAKWHRCHHDEPGNIPCEPEQEI